MTRFILLVVTLYLLARPSFASERFFPEGSLSSRTDVSEQMEDWYSEQLLAMNEKPLFPAPYGQKIYRFTWLRSFHNPMAFRLVVNPLGGGSMYATKNSGKGGYEPGTVLEAREIQLSAIEVARFEKELTDSEFWTLPRFDESTDGFDGAQWIMEAATSGVHHFVIRWSPDDPTFHTPIIKFMELSGMDLGEIY
jgi:hypothetical protein